jgi:hypothetical protein
MRLVGEAAGGCRVRRRGALPQKMPGVANAHVGLEGMWRDEILLAKGADHVGAAETRHLCQRLKPDLLVEMGGDMIAHTPHRERFVVIGRPDDLAAMAREHRGEYAVHALLTFQCRHLAAFYAAMGEIERPRQIRIREQLAAEARCSVEGATGHVLDDVGQQCHLGIDHPVAITFGCTGLAVMDFSGIDQVERTGSCVFARAADACHLTADLDGADRKGIVRVGGEFVGDEGGGQALHVAEAPVPPEAGLLLPRDRIGFGRLLLRNTVHSSIISGRRIFVLKKSARVARPIN